MEYPRLLICRRLVKPFVDSETRLRSVKQDISDNESEVLTHGAFVMAVASFEVAFSDALLYFLCHFPEKLADDQHHWSLSTAPTSRAEFLSQSAERYVWGLGYRSFSEYFDRFMSMFSIELDTTEKDLIVQLQEIKASRNLLLHNDLRVNETYLEKAGTSRRAERRDSRLQITTSYTTEAIDKMLILLNRVKISISSKYEHYTVIQANKRLWDFMFQTPIANYDDYWEVDKDRDIVVATKKYEREGMLSGSEKLKLGLWRAHATNDATYLEHFSMYKFDSENKAKVLFFLSLADNFPF